MSLRSAATRFASRMGDRVGSAVSARRAPGRPERFPLPPPRSEPGTRTVVDGFFDGFPAFYESSETSSTRWRLNLRHEAIIHENRDLFTGARILDIASHDGRWSMAALEAGAAEVIGIEARPELVEHARRNLQGYGVDESRWRFIQGDVFDVLGKEDIEVDVVLCLGFFYHTLRHNELLARIRQTGAGGIVLDTEIHRSEEPVMRIGREYVARQGNAVADDTSFGDVVLTGRPSVPALDWLGRGQGFEMERLSDWASVLRDNPGADQVRDYRSGRRVTCRYRRHPGPIDWRTT